MKILSRYKVSKAISILMEQHDPGSEKYNQALHTLQSEEAEKVIPKVIEALAENKNNPVLENLLFSLLNRSQLHFYIQALAHPDHSTKASIARILIKSDSFNPNQLLPLLNDPRVSNSDIAAILSAHSSKLHIRQLLAMVDKASSTLRPILYQLITPNLSVELLPALIARSNSEEPMVRAFIAKSISQFHTQESVNTLVKMLHDPVKTVREAGLRGLARLKAQGATEVICQLLADPDLTVQAAAIDTLVQINAPDVVRYLIDILQDESEYVRRAAVEVLNVVGNQTAIKDLLNALRDADWWVKVRAADALGSIGGPKVFAAVLALIKDPDEFLRRTAVEILNNSNDTRAFDRLIEALDDDDWWVRERAIDALAALGDKRAVPYLLKMLDSVPEAGPILIKALAKLGDKRVIGSVLKQLRNGNDNTQKEALKALGILTDRAHVVDVQDAITEIIKTNDPELRSLANSTIITLAKKFGMDQGTKESLLLDFQDKATDEVEAAPGAAAHVVVDAALLKSGDIFSDRYRVIKQVGKGAFGVVVLVEDTVVCDQFILKFLNPHVAKDENVIKRFTHELRYSRKIAHPNVIRIYDFITHGKNYAISMEYFPSHSLTYEINRGIVSEQQRALNMLRQICSGMAAAQSVHVVHRDLKPGNILVNKHDQIKIVDFGLAAAASKAEGRLTKTGILVGTPSYMAPEQVRSKTIDSRTDIYSLGIIMYEIFTGKPPYTGDDSMGIMFQHVEGNATPPRQLNPEISHKLERIILKAIAVEPSDRYQSFVDLELDLKELELEKV